MQSIGLKQFHDYFHTIHANDSESLQPLQLACVSMKTATRQYARSQIKWIRNKTLSQLKRKCNANDTIINVLDSTNINKWDLNVLQPAISIWESFVCHVDNLHCDSLTGYPKSLLEFREEIAHQWKTYTCETCIDTTTHTNKIVYGDYEWNIHVKSRAHKRCLSRLNNPYLQEKLRLLHIETI